MKKAQRWHWQQARLDAGGSLKVRAASRAAIVQAWRLLRRGPSTRWGAVIVGLAFVLSSIWYSARGIRFDISTLPYFDQLLDPILLRTRLWQSLYYLHGQPPLFNLLAGVALKLEPTYHSYCSNRFFCWLACIRACACISRSCAYACRSRSALRSPASRCRRPHSCFTKTGSSIRT